MLNNEQVKEIVASALPDIKERVIQQLKASATSQVVNAMGATVENEVKDFLKAEIAPEVAAYLIQNKAALLEAAIKASSAICDEIMAAIVGDVKKKLAQEWDRRRILDAIFAR